MLYEDEWYIERYTKYNPSKRENEEEGRGFKEYKTKKVRLNS